MAETAGLRKRSRKAAAEPRPREARAAVTPGPGPKPRGRPRQEIVPALARAIETATDLLASAGAEDALTRYKVARIVAHVKGAPGRYGERAVGTLARSIKIGKKTLYHYAEVVETWDPREFRKLASRRGSGGRALPWSMFLELALIRDGRKRAALIETAFAKDLSVRAIRKIVPGGVEDRPDEFLESFLRKSARFASLVEVLRDRLVKGDVEWNRELLTSCRDSLGDLSKKLPVVVGALRQLNGGSAATRGTGE